MYIGSTDDDSVVPVNDVTLPISETLTTWPAAWSSFPIACAISAVDPFSMHMRQGYVPWYFPNLILCSGVYNPGMVFIREKLKAIPEDGQYLLLSIINRYNMTV